MRDNIELRNQREKNKSFYDILVRISICSKLIENGTLDQAVCK